MSLRSLTTTQGYQMGFFFSSDFPTMNIGDRFARQGGFKTFFDKTFLELLDFFGAHFIRRCNVFVCPTTGPISFEENIGINDPTSLGLVLCDYLWKLSTFDIS